MPNETENQFQSDGLFTNCHRTDCSDTGKIIKRSKSFNSPRISCIDLTPAPIPEEISGHESSFPMCLRRPHQPTQATPCGSFEKLPNELIYMIFRYLPLTSIGKLGETSRAMRDISIRWTCTKQMLDRLINRILQANLSPLQKNWTGKLTLPQQLHDMCEDVGILLKRLTCLFPTAQRLQLHHQFTKQIKNSVLDRSPGYEHHIIEATAGAILHSLILGWDKHECKKAYICLCQWNNIRPSLKEFFKTPDPIDSNEEVARSLRLFLRSHFLDFCSSRDRSLWHRIIFDEPELADNAYKMKLMFLLYAPIESKGILWNFYEDHMDYSCYIEEYKNIAQTIGYLSSPAKKKSSAKSIDVINTISRLSTQWSSRAVASVLLCLYAIDSKLATIYFQHLSSSGQTYIVTDILSETVYVASGFITYEPKVDPIVSYRTVLKMIQSAINCGWSHEDRHQIVHDMWDEIREMAHVCLNEAIAMGDSEEIHYLLETWKEISILLTY